MVNKKRKKGSHLTWNDRLILERMLIKGFSKKEIAETLGCCLATVYHEIKRATYIHLNSDLTEEVRYNPDLAQADYEKKMSVKGARPKLLEHPDLASFIEKMIRDFNYSPEAALYLIKTNSLEFRTTVCTTTVYNAISSGLLPSLTMKDLPYKVDRKAKKKRHIQKQAARIHGTSIDERPAYVLDRTSFGDWEMDSVVGKAVNKKTILTLTERKTRFQIYEVLKTHTAREVVKALNRIEKRYGAVFYEVFRSITVDNGSEFQDDYGIQKALYRVGDRTKLYYCHPYSSWERGSNENSNRMIRRFFPKGSDFDETLNKRDLKEAEIWINIYPRRMFGGKSSEDLYIEELESLGLDFSRVLS